MLEFRLLGSLKLQGSEGEQILSVLSQPKRVALLSYLAVAEPRGFHRRDKLVNLFWPDLDQDRARAALRKSLHHLRRSLGEEAVLSRGDEEVGLGFDSIRCDVFIFEEAMKTRPEEAMDLYRGHLLEGFHLAGCQEFQRWLDDERERLKELAAGAAWELAHRFASAGLLADGERMGQRALAMAPTDEAQVRRFMEALAKAGGRAAALAFYERFARTLEGELELRPDAESRSLVERIRNSLVFQTPTGRDATATRAGGGEPAPTDLDPDSEAKTRAAGSGTSFDSFRAAIGDRYRIEREIGSGGMATVYLAQDLKHERKVAVKVLKPELAAVMGTERFLAEIRTTASLQHPHILPLHDSGEADGFLFYVMPFVDGESLRQRLDRKGQLAVEDAVRIAEDVASALDHAHREGVIHRDIKPANILFEGGQPVITDFGIALAVSAAGEGRLTETGLSLGTPYYMSPEQAAGDQTPTAASDVYSLGCVLYEMLTGEPPHTGTSAQAVLGKILMGEVANPTGIRRTIPPHVEATILRALERLPVERFSTAAEMAAALQDESFRHGETVASPGPSRYWRALALTLTVLAAGLGVGVLTLLTWDAPGPVVRIAVAFPPGQELNNVSGVNLAFTPEGSHLIYVGPEEGRGRQLWIRALDGHEAVPIPGTTGATNPAPSPGGESVAFVIGDSLLAAPVEGGTRLTLVADSVGVNGIDWGDDGFIYFRHEDGRFFRVHGRGGAAEELLIPDSTRGVVQYRWPDALPGGEAVLVSNWTLVLAETSVSVLDLRSGELIDLLPQAMMARYLPPGYILFCHEDGALWYAPFDLGSLSLQGPPLPLPEAVWVRAGAGSQFTVSNRGDLAYIPGTGAARRIVWVDREGVPTLVDPRLAGGIRQAVLSPDGRRIAFVRRGVTDDAIWVFDIVQSALFLVSSDGRNSNPFWAPSGERIGYMSESDGVLKVVYSRWDGSGNPVTVTEGEKVRDANWAPDGQFLLATVEDSSQDIVRIDLGGDEGQEVLVGTDLNENNPILSPNGRWLAYTSDESGQFEVYVRPYPGMEPRTQVSPGTGGSEARWSPAGGELFYRDGSGNLVAATYTEEGSFSITSRDTLFPAEYFVSRETDFATGSYYSVAPTGEIFLFVEYSGLTSGPNLILNFREELRERAEGAG
ncbi:MAG: protein kinase [Gemmatimonadota bacterium]|jgi:serine/threonine-protein kinase